MNSAFVYWERQRSDQLYAVHCINSLLQGPFVTEIDLGQLGQAIDQEEQSVSLRSRSVGENVSMEGYFSIQVIMRALTHHGVALSYKPDFCKETRIPPRK
jgi:ataxin-3